VLGDSDLLRALTLARIPCVVMAAPGDPARYSRFARKVLDWADAWDRPDALVDVLERFAASQASRPVLFYEADHELLLISRYRERLRRHFDFVIPDATLVDDLVDKGRFQVLARRLNLPVPPAQVLNPSSDPMPLDLQFPLALKPLVRRADQWTPIAHGAKALRLDSAAALATVWPRLAQAGIAVVLQRLIPGSETKIESYHVYVDNRGDIAGEFTGQKIRTWPAAYGDSTALVTTASTEVTDLGRDLVRRLGLRGVAKFDFKRAPDGRLYLFDCALYALAPSGRARRREHPGARVRRSGRSAAAERHPGAGRGALVQAVGRRVGSARCGYLVPEVGALGALLRGQAGRGVG
jgi:predicted ATP-grasp superfamily ATP-dependent carboligase